MNKKITGGWSASGYVLSGYTNDGLISFTEGQNYINVNSSKKVIGTQYVSIFGTNNAIKLTNKYTKINYDYYCTGKSGSTTTAYLRSSMSTAKNTAYSDEWTYTEQAATVNIRKTYQRTLKATSGYYYFVLNNHPNGANSCGYMYNIWLS